MPLLGEAVVPPPSMRPAIPRGSQASWLFLSSGFDGGGVCASAQCGGDVVLDGLRMADGGRKGEKKVGVWLGWAGVISGGVRCCLLCGRWTLDLDPLQRRAGSACGPGGGNGVFSANGVPGWLVRRQVLPLLAVGGSAMARLGCSTTHGSRPWGAV